MTEAELAAIEARCQAATSGPWHTDGPPGTIWSDIRQEDGFPLIAVDVADRDTAFIAAARTDIPALIAEIRRLQRILNIPGTHYDPLPTNTTQEQTTLRAALEHLAERWGITQDAAYWSEILDAPATVEWYDPPRIDHTVMLHRCYGVAHVEGYTIEM